MDTITTKMLEKDTRLHTEYDNKWENRKCMLCKNPDGLFIKCKDCEYYTEERWV